MTFDWYAAFCGLSAGAWLTWMAVLWWKGRAKREEVIRELVERVAALERKS